MHTAPEEYKAKCEVCKEAVAYDESKDWAKCTRLPGHHRVEEKTYYHLGGSHLANLIDRRTLMANNKQNMRETIP